MSLRFTRIHSDDADDLIRRLVRADRREAEFAALLEMALLGLPDRPQYESVLDYDPVLRWHCRLD